MPDLAVSSGTGTHLVRASCALLGNDLNLSFSGGEAPHIGAVALAVPRPSLEDASRASASASVLCVTGHKEDLLARKLALEASSRLNCRVAVAVGLHIGAASEQDIARLLANCEAALELLLQKIVSGPSSISGT